MKQAEKNKLDSLFVEKFYRPAVRLLQKSGLSVENAERELDYWLAHQVVWTARLNGMRAQINTSKGCK